MARDRGQGGSWWRELWRPAEGRLLAGVGAGLAQALVIDVTLVRLALILLGLASGIGVVLYLVLWLLLPSEEQLRQQRGELGLPDLLRHNVSSMGDDLRRSSHLARAAWQRAAGEATPWPRPLTRRWIAILLIGGGLFVFLYSIGLFSWLGPGRTLGLLMAASGVAVLLSRASELNRR